MCLCNFHLDVFPVIPVTVIVVPSVGLRSQFGHERSDRFFKKSWIEDLPNLIKIINIQLENFQIEERILESCIYYFASVINRGLAIQVQRTLEKMIQAGIRRTSASIPPWIFEVMFPVHVVVDQESQDGNKEFWNLRRRNPAEARVQVLPCPPYLACTDRAARCNLLQHNISASDVILFQTENLRIRLLFIFCKISRRD